MGAQHEQGALWSGLMLSALSAGILGVGVSAWAVNYARNADERALCARGHRLRVDAGCGRWADRVDVVRSWAG